MKNKGTLKVQATAHPEASVLPSVVEEDACNLLSPWRWSRKTAMCNLLSAWYFHAGFSIVSWLMWVLMSALILKFYYPASPEILPEPGDALETFKNAHFSCFRTPQICLCACFCPAVQWADTMNLAGFFNMRIGMVLFSVCALFNILLLNGIQGAGMCTGVLIALHRQRLRAKLGLKSWTRANCIRDLLYVCCCPWCAISQEAQVVRYAYQQYNTGDSAHEASSTHKHAPPDASGVGSSAESPGMPMPQELPTSRTIPFKALCIYLGVTWLAIVFVVIAGLTTGAGTSAGWSVAPVSMLFVMLMTFLGERLGFVPYHAALDLQPLANTSPRMVWMDNAKVVLIVLVVMGHTGMAFSGLGAAGISLASEKITWFTPAAYTGVLLLKPLIVPLFFFISGFVAPSAFDRKGPRGFMRASFMRLGLAYFIFWLVLNPLTYCMAYALARPAEGTYAYFPNSAHTWFLNWLLVFQCCYALLDCATVRKEIPGFSELLMWSFCVTFLQLAACVALLVGGSMLGIAEGPMLGPGGDGFFCALMFTTGIIAKRNDWLLNPLPPRLVQLSRFGVLAMVVIAPLVSFTVFSPANPNYSSDTMGFAFLALQLPSGPYLVCAQVSAIDLFQRRCNFETSFTKVAAGCVFGVYLIHYSVVNLFSYLWVDVLRAVFEIKVQFTDAIATSTEIKAEYLYGGFVCVTLLSVVTSFVLAGVMKLTPFLQDLL